MNIIWKINDNKNISEIEYDKKIKEDVDKMLEDLLLKSDEFNDNDNSINIMCVKNKKENWKNLCHLLEKTEWINKKIAVFSIGKKIKQITGIKRNTRILADAIYICLSNNCDEIIEVNDVKKYVENNCDFLRNYKKEYFEI